MTVETIVKMTGFLSELRKDKVTIFVSKILKYIDGTIGEVHSSEDENNEN